MDIRQSVAEEVGVNHRFCETATKQTTLTRAGLRLDERGPALIHPAETT